MNSSNNFIGIQYNWREGESFPLKARLQKAVSDRIEVQDDGVLINYPDGQGPSGQNRMLLDQIIPEALPISDYSNIYLRLPLAPAAAPNLRAKGRINVPTVTDATDFLANFSDLDADLAAALQADPRYSYYNELHATMAKAMTSAEMLHTLEAELETAEEWGTEGDWVFFSCMGED
jgi:hypothetical protein